MEIYGKYIESRRNHFCKRQRQSVCSVVFCGINGAGLYHSAGAIVKGCERRLSALAHGNYNLLIGDR